MISNRPNRLAIQALEERSVPVAGELDSLFSGDGIVRFSLPGYSLVRMNDVLVSPTGKVIASGWVDGQLRRPAVFQFNDDGSLDTNFDGDGIAILDLAGNWGDFSAIQRQADGKLVASGTTRVENNHQVLLARFEANGSPDLSFGGGDGFTTTDIQPRDENGFDLALQPDGKIVVCGNILGEGFDEFIGFDGFLFLRYESDGTLDPTFGMGGWTFYNSGGSGSLGRGVVVQPDGKIVAAGYGSPPGEPGRGFQLVRLNSDGSMDTSFSGDGIATALIGTEGLSEAEDIALMPNGKFVVAGVTVVPGATGQPSVARFTSNGELDKSFSRDGSVIVPVGDIGGHAYGVVVQGDGKVLVASTGPSSSLLMRFNANGTLDTRFGPASCRLAPGIVVTDVAPDDGDEFYAVTIAPDGKYVAVGAASADASAVRYLNTQIGKRLTVNFVNPPLRVRPGMSVIYTIAYKNTGGQFDAGVALIVRLPTYSSFNAALSSQGWVNLGGGRYRIEVGDLAVNQGGQVRFAVNLRSSIPIGTWIGFTAGITDAALEGKLFASRTTYAFLGLRFFH